MDFRRTRKSENHTNKPKEYSPERMAKYAEAESQTCRSNTPRRTSDHLNDSASDAKDLFALAKLSHPAGQKSLPFQ